MSFSTASSKEHQSPLKSIWVKISFLAFLLVWMSSFVWTSDLSNWLLENVLTFALLGFLLLSYKRYPFSDLSYLLIFIYLCLHVYGSQHTYAENPFGFWLQDVLELSRNPYDRIVHFSFGFLLAYPMREVCIKFLEFPAWVGYALPVEVTLSLSALYEVIEWGVADLFFPHQGTAYLELQGDVWDAQKDMLLAFSGAFIASMITLVIKSTFATPKQQ